MFVRQKAEQVYLHKTGNGMGLKKNAEPAEETVVYEQQTLDFTNVM